MALLHQLIRSDELAQLTPGEMDALASRLDSEIVRLVQRQDVQQFLGKRMQNAASVLQRARRQRASGGGGGGSYDEPPLSIQDDDEI